MAKTSVPRGGRAPATALESPAHPDTAVAASAPRLASVPTRKLSGCVLPVGAAPRAVRASLLFLGATVAFAVLPACAPLPPTDPSISLREGEGSDAEAESDAGDPAPVTAEPTGPLTWVASEADAVAQSKAERRPMLLHFASEWCSVCKRMAKETFGDPRVKTQAGRFVAVRIDASNDDDPQVSAALSKYAVITVPTLLLFDSSGHEQRRFTDFIRPDTLLGEIAQVR